MRNKNLYKVILTALFTALSFAGVYVQIKLPVGMIHLGNFVCIISSMLIGGILGGTSGAIGMMLADISMGYGVPSAVRTLILKFLMGLIAGSLFKIFVKHKKSNGIANLVITIILGISTILMTVISALSYQNKFVVSYTKITSDGSKLVEKVLTFHWIIPVLIGVLFLMSLFVLIFRRKLNRVSSAALVSASIGIAFNIFGEVFIKTLIYYWLNASYDTMDAAFMYSVSGLPSTIITSIITVVLVGFIFYPIYKAILSTNASKELGLINYESDNENE